MYVSADTSYTGSTLLGLRYLSCLVSFLTFMVQSQSSTVASRIGAMVATPAGKQNGTAKREIYGTLVGAGAIFARKLYLAAAHPIFLNFVHEFSGALPSGFSQPYRAGIGSKRLRWSFRTETGTPRI